jgi:hypothetical protein
MTPAAPIDWKRTTNERTCQPSLRLREASVLDIASVGIGFSTTCCTASAVMFAVPVAPAANVLVEAPSVT